MFDQGRHRKAFSGSRALLWYRLGAANRIARPARSRNSTQRNLAEGIRSISFTDTQVIQDFPGTWVQAIAADFLSRKLSSFDNQGR